MGIQTSMIYQFPPVSLLAPATDAAGRTSAYRNLKNAIKAYLVCHINQGNAAQVTLSALQAQDVNGTNSKAISLGAPIFLNDTTASSDAFVQQLSATTFQTDATVANKIVVFEIIPQQALDEVNGFHTIAVSTSASNAANITSAMLHVIESFQGASQPSTYS